MFLLSSLFEDRVVWIWVAQSRTRLPTLELGGKDRRVLAKRFILLVVASRAVRAMLWASLSLRAKSWASGMEERGREEGYMEESNDKSGLNLNKQ